MSSLQNIRHTIRSLPAVALYFSSVRCTVCKVLQPKLEALIFEEFPEILFIPLQSEKSPEIPAAFSVFTAPTFVVFFDGKEVLRKSQNMGMQEIATALKRPYSILFSN